MYVVSLHVTREEKNLSYNTNCYIHSHQAQIVAISAALFTPRRTFFPFGETGGKSVNLMTDYASTSEPTFCKF